MMEKTLRQRATELMILGCWHVHCRLTLDESIALFERALDRGINNFDIVDYWDNDIANTRRFREIMTALAIPRDSYRVGAKVFPNNVDSRDTVLRRELDRMGLEYVDYVLCSRPTQGESMEHAVECMHQLVADGLAKRLDMAMWDPVVAAEAIQMMKDRGLTVPVSMQFPYNIGRRDVVESEDYVKLFKDGLKLSAGFTMEGGVLCGHTNRRRYEPEEKAQGIWFEPGERNLTRDHGGIREKIVAVVPRLNELAATLGVEGGQLAMAYVVTNPYLESLVFGATKLWQIDKAIEAVELGLTKPEIVRDMANQVYVSGAAVPGYFEYGRFKL